MRKAEAQGWTVSRRPNGHLKWVSPDGEVDWSGSTPNGGQRSNENMKAKLKRRGLK
jgi:hypothetical protein